MLMLSSEAALAHRRGIHRPELLVVPEVHSRYLLLTV